MAYITTAQLAARLGADLYARLTDREGGALASEQTAAQIVAEAEALVNSMLATRYATPIDLAAHPELADVLAARTLDVAEGLAWRGSPFASDIPERVRTLAEQADLWLAAVAGGKAVLPASAPPAARTSVLDSPRHSSSARAFTHDELDGL